uniref:Dihydrolipoamide S-succinyltransferase n=1 Tax=Petromyzon marinus TaxID=7757 RepID=S4RBL1_PETMA
ALPRSTCKLRATHSDFRKSKWPLAGHFMAPRNDGHRGPPLEGAPENRFLFHSSVENWSVRSFKTSAYFCEEVRVINTPAFAESVTEGDVRWEKAVGDFVKEDEVVCEIETDKTSIQVPAPSSGVIQELLVEDGGRVEAGNPLFKLKITGRRRADAGAAAVAKPAAQAPAAAKPAAEAAAPQAPSGAGPIPTTMPPVPPVPKKPLESTP